MSQNARVEVQKSKRFQELEGLRGIAAVIVVVYHALIIFFAGAFYGLGDLAPVQHLRFEDNIYGNPLAGLLSGAFAVSVFFVLSGFVLSIGYFQTGKTILIKNLATKRYLRLMLPALASILFAYVVIKLGFAHTYEISLISKSIEGKEQWSFVPNIWEAIKSGVYGIFIEGYNPYNRVLWTMMTEFAGSFLIFGSLLIFGESRFRWILYGILIFLTFNNLFLGFILGMIFADLYSVGVIKQQNRNLIVATSLLLLGVVLGGYPDGSLNNTFYSLLSQIHLDSNNVPIRFYSTIGAALVLFVVLRTWQFANFLRLKPLSILGKYTFSLYLVHMTILFSLTTGLFMQFYPLIGYNKAAVVSIILSVPVIWIVTILFEKYVDQPSIKLAGYWADIYLGRRNFELGKKVNKVKIVTIAGLSAMRSRLSEKLVAKQQFDGEDE